MRTKKKVKKKSNLGGSKHANEHSFKPGNQLWKRRSSCGVKSLFSDPEILWEEAQKYFDLVDAHPLYAVEYKGTKRVCVPYARPYTVHGLVGYLGVHTDYWREFKKSVTGQQPVFAPIIKAIEDKIYNQKFEGAAAGFFNANIIARDLGLRDASDVTTGGDKIVTAAPVINVYGGDAPKLAGDEEEVLKRDNKKKK